MSWIRQRTEALFGSSAPAALDLLYGPMAGVPAEHADRIRAEMLWLSNGDLDALRALRADADRDWRDIDAPYQAEVNLERFRTPPRRDWILWADGWRLRSDG